VRLLVPGKVVPRCTRLHELEGPCGDFLPCAGDADDDALAPTLARWVHVDTNKVAGNNAEPPPCHETVKTAKRGRAMHRVKAMGSL
jgi:hypothetical protein